MATAKFTWNVTVLNALNQQMSQGLYNLGLAVGAAEKRRAPVESGTLVNSIDVKRESATTVIVQAGGGSVPYARRRNFENKLHPNTKHYMENGAEDVLRGGIAQYFRGGVAK